MVAHTNHSWFSLPDTETDTQVTLSVLGSVVDGVGAGNPPFSVSQVQALRVQSCRRSTSLQRPGLSGWAAVVVFTFQAAGELEKWPIGSHCRLSFPLPEMSNKWVINLKLPFLQTFLSYWCWFQKCDQFQLRILFHSWLNLSFPCHFLKTLFHNFSTLSSGSCCLLIVIISAHQCPNDTHAIKLFRIIMVLGEKGVLFLFLPLLLASTVTLSLEGCLCVSSSVTCWSRGYKSQGSNSSGLSNPAQPGLCARALCLSLSALCRQIQEVWEPRGCCCCCCEDVFVGEGASLAFLVQ